MKIWQSYARRLRGLSVAVIAATAAVGSVASAHASSSTESGQIQLDLYAVLAKPLVGSAVFVLAAGLSALAAVGLHRSVLNEARDQN